MIQTIGQIKNILLPTDFSDVSEKALDFAIGIAKYHNAKITVTNTFYIPVFTGAEMQPILPQVFFDEGEEISLKGLKNVCDRIKKETSLSGANLITDHIYRYDTASHEIVELTKEMSFDLLIMGTTGSDNLLGFFESVTLDVVAEIACPILIVKLNSFFNPFRNVYYALKDINRDFFSTINLVSLVRPFNAMITILHSTESKNIQLATDNNEAKEEEYFILVKAIKDYTNYNRIKQETVYDDKSGHTLNENLKMKEIDLLVLLKHENHGIIGLFHQSFIKHFLKFSNTPLLIMHRNIGR